MKHKVHLVIGIPVLIIGLGSTLLLQNGYAQTWEPRQIVGQRLEVVNLSDEIALDPQSNDTIMWGVQPENETANPEENESMRTINVSGMGQVMAHPDLAIVRLGVQTEAGTAAEALAQNSSQMQNLLSALHESGVAAADIQTQAVQLHPRYDEQHRNRRLTGYTAINLVELRILNLGELGRLLDTAVGAGANTIQGVSFEVSNSTALLDRAREAAMQEARHKAERLAALANAELDEVVTIHESSQLPSPILYEHLAAKSSLAVPIEPGAQSLRVDVQVTWSLR